MAKGLIHGENGDMLQMESVFLIKVLSRFSWFELFHLVRWKGAFPSAFRAALAALVCDTASTVLAERMEIRRRNAVSVPKSAGGAGGSSALRREAQADFGVQQQGWGGCHTACPAVGGQPFSQGPLCIQKFN